MKKIALILICLVAVGCGSDAGSGSGTHCTNSAYPLWCPNAEVCCTSGHAHYCDGKCSAEECGSATVTRDNCSPE